MITAQLVKELRDKTGAGMLDCKKALEACEGDIAKAIDWLREKGIAKAAKKADRIAAEGLTRVAVEGNLGVICEVNSETDFVAKNEQFLALLDTVTSTLLQTKPATLEEALQVNVEGKSLDAVIMEASATIGEKITLRRFSLLEKTDNDAFGAYMHMGGKISALVRIDGSTDEVVAKDIAMHVAAMNPQFIDRSYMSAEFVEHERGIQLELTKNDPKLAEKPEKVLVGIVEGKLSKILQEMCLLDQAFFKNPDQKVAEYVKSCGGKVGAMIRFAVGEGIEKRQDNFAEEVMNQVRGQ